MYQTDDCLLLQAKKPVSQWMGSDKVGRASLLMPLMRAGGGVIGPPVRVLIWAPALGGIMWVGSWLTLRLQRFDMQVTDVPSIGGLSSGGSSSGGSSSSGGATVKSIVIPLAVSSIQILSGVAIWLRPSRLHFREAMLHNRLMGANFRGTRLHTWILDSTGMCSLTDYFFFTYMQVSSHGGESVGFLGIYGTWLFWWSSKDNQALLAYMASRHAGGVQR